MAPVLKPFFLYLLPRLATPALRLWTVPLLTPLQGWPAYRIAPKWLWSFDQLCYQVLLMCPKQDSRNEEMAPWLRILAAHL